MRASRKQSKMVEQAILGDTLDEGEWLRQHLSLPDITTESLDEFYEGFDKLHHDETGEEIVIAPHQYEAWNDRFDYLTRLYIKSQKIGLSTLFLIEDIHHALTDCKGKQIFIVGQSVSQAMLHLSDFVRIMKNSIYKDYVIEKPVPWLKMWQVTKSAVAYIHNPDNPRVPTEVFALGPAVQSLLSFKRVGHAHVSDISIADYTPERLNRTLGAITSRLANTRGSIVIETPPTAFEGFIWDWYERDAHNKEAGFMDMAGKRHPNLVDIPRKMQTDWLVRQYPYQLGLDSGMTTPAFIESKRKELGPLFGFYFEASFYSSDKVWYRREDIKPSDSSTEFFMNASREQNESVLA